LSDRIEEDWARQRLVGRHRLENNERCASREGFGKTLAESPSRAASIVAKAKLSV